MQFNKYVENQAKKCCSRKLLNFVVQYMPSSQFLVKLLSEGLELLQNVSMTQNFLETIFRARLQVGHWIRITPLKFVKIQKTSALVCEFFCILIPCAKIFSIAYLQTTDKYKNLNLKMKSAKYIWLPISWSHLTTVVQHRSQIMAICRGFTRVCTPEREVTLTKSSIPSQLLCTLPPDNFFCLFFPF